MDLVAAVLLDMDGTLVDSDAAVVRAWTTWADEHGVSREAAMALAHGGHPEYTAQRLLPNLDAAGVQAAARRQLHLQYQDLDDVGPARGAGPLLATLARLGMPWAVVTNADARLAGARLAAAGVEAPLLITLDDVAAGKPDPEGYLLAAERLGVPPGRCLVVEDSEPGLAAGRAAGARTAALRGLSGDVRVDDLAHLARLLSGSAAA